MALSRMCARTPALFFPQLLNLLATQTLSDDVTLRSLHSHLTFILTASPDAALDDKEKNGTFHAAARVLLLHSQNNEAHNLSLLHQCLALCCASDAVAEELMSSSIVTNDNVLAGSLKHAILQSTFSPQVCPIDFEGFGFVAFSFFPLLI